MSPKNKMAYEVIMVYHLHMPFFFIVFPDRLFQGSNGIAFV